MASLQTFLLTGIVTCFFGTGRQGEKVHQRSIYLSPFRGFSHVATESDFQATILTTKWRSKAVDPDCGRAKVPRPSPLPLLSRSGIIVDLSVSECVDPLTKTEDSLRGSCGGGLLDRNVYLRTCSFACNGRGVLLNGNGYRHQGHGLSTHCTVSQRHFNRSHVRCDV